MEQHDGAPQQPLDLSSVTDAVPTPEPRSRYGNPPSYEVFGKQYQTLPSSQGYLERGIASWYGTKFHGRRTSSGDPYDMYAMTAAHKTLPLPTYARVTNLRNGNTAVLKINDRGPFHENRIIDLSYAAASRLGILAEGTGLVEVEALDPHQAATQTNATPQSMEPASVAIYIQVGAFRSEQNATQLRDRLKDTVDHETRIEQEGPEDQPFYRVQVGPIESVRQADRVTESLSRTGIDSFHIVVN